MHIRNLGVAREFVHNACGDAHPALAVLDEKLDMIEANPWAMLGENVRTRLRQWFHPQTGEKFLTYVPDRDLARTEDGMAGVVVSNLRVIFHSQARHRQALREEPIEFRTATKGTKAYISIKTTGWEITRITIDRDGMRLLRRAITTGGFNATWV
jgi:hypothetical protein